MSDRKFAPMTSGLLVRKGGAAPSHVVLPFAPPNSLSRVRRPDIQLEQQRVKSTAVQEAYRRWRAARMDSHATRPALLDNMGLPNAAQRRAGS
jgi:hypothetical protein